MNKNETCLYMMSRKDGTRKENQDLRKDKFILKTSQDTFTNTTKSV